LDAKQDCKTGPQTWEVEDLSISEPVVGWKKTRVDCIL